MRTHYSYHPPLCLPPLRFIFSLQQYIIHLIDYTAAFGFLAGEGGEKKNQLRHSLSAWASHSLPYFDREVVRLATPPKSSAPLTRWYLQKVLSATQFIFLFLILATSANLTLHQEHPVPFHLESTQHYVLADYDLHLEYKL